MLCVWHACTVCTPGVTCACWLVRCVAAATGLAGAWRFQGTGWLEVLCTADHHAMSCWPCSDVCLFSSLQLTGGSVHQLPVDVCRLQTTLHWCCFITIWCDMHFCHPHRQTLTYTNTHWNQRHTDQQNGVVLAKGFWRRACLRLQHLQLCVPVGGTCYSSGQQQFWGMVIAAFGSTPGMLVPAYKFGAACVLLCCAVVDL